MARTVTQISQSIKANFVANETLQEVYALDTAKSFDEQFSSVSLESIIIYIISLAHYSLEVLMDAFISEIDTKISESYLASIPWFYSKVLEFQFGYSLTLNESTYKFEYSNTDEEAKVIKYAAIRQVEDTITKLKIYVADANKEPITVEQQIAFEAYIKKVGPAGIHYEFINQNADLLNITVQVIFDPLILNDSGQKLTDGSYPVRDAIQAYIDGITFGGIFNRTKLVDAIQSAEGVNDVVLTLLEHSEYGGSFSEVSGQNISSAAGSFVVDTLTDAYTPDV